MAFWREWWARGDTLDEPIDPVPPPYMPENVRDRSEATTSKRGERWTKCESSSTAPTSGR